MSDSNQHVLTADGYTLCTAPYRVSVITAWINRYDQEFTWSGLDWRRRRAEAFH